MCAKCCCKVTRTVGRDISEVEAERKELEEAIKNARERDRRTLIRAMNNKSKPEHAEDIPQIGDRSREGDLFPVSSLDEYAELARQDDDDDDVAEDFVCK